MAIVNQNPFLVYEEFGFVKDLDLPDGRVRGHCPLCPPAKSYQGKEGHFYIHPIDAKHPQIGWDCKRCGRSGGYQKFLQFVIEVSHEGTEDKIRELAKDRGLEPDTLFDLGAGWINGFWILPVWSRDMKVVLNIKRYDGVSFMNTAGCHSAMYGLWLLPKEGSYKKSQVLEGEWDYAAWYEIMKKTNGLANNGFLAVPGAGTFKPEIAGYFAGTEVSLLYDNDMAGRNGMKRAIDVLFAASPSPVIIKRIVWPWEEIQNRIKGKDVRDVYANNRVKSPCYQNAKKSIEFLLGACVKEQVKSGTILGSNANSDEDIKPVPYQEVYSTFQKWLYLKDNPGRGQKSTDIYDIIFGTIIANRFPGAPVWMYIIAPPGGLKTEPLMSLYNAKGIRIEESVTPPALISGINFGSGNDPSIISQINGMVLVIKELTTMLNQPEQERREIWGILRGAFDEMCIRTLGNGIRREIHSKFGILAAVTPAIEQYNDEMVAVGERFLSWRNWLPEDYAQRRLLIKKAFANVPYEVEMRAELNAMAKKVLNANYKMPAMPDDKISDQLIAMSQWIATMRTPVPREKYSKEVLYRPFSELATRISKELVKLLLGITAFRGYSTIRPDIIRIGASVARSSVNSRFLDIVILMFSKKDQYCSLTELMENTGLPKVTLEMLLENMRLLNIVAKRITDSKMGYMLNKQFIQLTIESEVLSCQ